MVQPTYDPNAMPGNKSAGIPRRSPTRRLDERQALALAADRLEELLATLENPRNVQHYDFGTVNLICDLRRLAGLL